MTNMDSGLRDPAQLDQAISGARAELLRVAEANGFLIPHLCGCGRPTCRNANPETISTGALLRAVSSEWVGGPDPEGEPVLRERLLAFAEAFGLTECPEGDPECHCAQLHRSDTRQVVRAVADAWHGRAGNPGPGAQGGTLNLTTDGVREMAEDHAHNLRVLDALAFFIDPDRGPGLRSVAGAARASEGSAWLLEARAMATEALASWVPDCATLPEVEHVLGSALAVSFEPGWDAEESAYLERAAADACRAILVRGIAHDSVVEALFAAFRTEVSLADLDACADTELLVDLAAAS